jgi:hypothetical protein
MADERIAQATVIVQDGMMTVNEKLTKIDELMPLPATASADQLGGMLGVTKQAVLKSEWWTQNRKGEKADEVGRRRTEHRKRAKLHEQQPDGDDE